MENQNENPSRVKTHEEILQLFHEVKLAEEKVRNPEALRFRPPESTMVLPGTTSPSQIRKGIEAHQQPFVPQGEIPSPKMGERDTVVSRLEEQESLAKKKPKWFSFLKREEPESLDVELPQTVKHSEVEKKIPRTTFVLQLNAEGNLVGFPQKKSHPNKGISQESNQAEEQATGIKGRLKQLTSRFHRKTSETSESSGGIGTRIKGIFRRKSEE